MRDLFAKWAVPHADGTEVTPVTPPFSAGVTGHDAANPAEIKGSEGQVTPVTPVTPKNGHDLHARGDHAGVVADLGIRADYERRRLTYRHGGMPAGDADHRAYGHAQLDWHQRHGKKPVPGRCAGCGAGLPDRRIIVLADGAAVHDLACLRGYGARWRDAAEAGLRAEGVTRPEGWRHGEG